MIGQVRTGDIIFRNLQRKPIKAVVQRDKKRKTLMLNFKRDRNLPANYYCM